MSIDLSRMPKLGFGLMRLPEKDGEVDLDRVKDMVDRYMKTEIRYFDTAYVYHGGKSEVAAREALVKRYPRESYMLATKLPAWEMKQAGDMDKIFNEQCERAGVDYFDFYLLHSIEEGPNYEKYEEYGAFEWGLKKKEEGKIRHFGFSFHGSPELLTKLLDDHPETEFVQIQLNYLDRTNPVVRSESLYQILLKRNIPIIIMEPVRGGMLANMAPEIEAKFKAERPESSVASWALRYVGSLPGVMTILSGMSTEEQVDDNIKTFTDFEPVTDDEMRLINEVTDEVLASKQIGCTACKYCTPGCPVKISIPDVFRAANTLRRYPDDWRAKNFYKGVAERGGKAGDCVACGQCERVCPQHLPIISLLKEASEQLDLET
ncbi:MAG: aldo/keto reductase [Lachnospiraceae bacterium]|nr:aldo/keto reductase [Lachnospiraceae bacterium]